MSDAINAESVPIELMPYRIQVIGDSQFWGEFTGTLSHLLKVIRHNYEKGFAHIWICGCKGTMAFRKDYKDVDSFYAACRATTKEERRRLVQAWAHTGADDLQHLRSCLPTRMQISEEEAIETMMRYYSDKRKSAIRFLMQAEHIRALKESTK